MNQQTPSIHLQEWQDYFVPDIVMSNRDMRLAEALSDRIEVRDMRNGVYIKASSWVGVLRFEAFTIRIKPKLSNLDVMRMLLIAGGFERMKRHHANRDYQLDEDISIFDLVALLLVDACNLILRDGLLHSYVLEEDDLPVMRGRMRVDEQVRRRYGQINRIECRFDDHHTDILDNQILNTALALCWRYARHPLVRGRVRYLSDIFVAACKPLQGDWREIRADMSYNRLNSHYKEAHSLAWVVLDGLGLNDLIAEGNINGFAFLLDMNPLFEAFVTILVESALKGGVLRITSQAKSGGHIWDVGRNRSYSNIIPDLLVENQSGQQLAIDAKYKRYDDYKLAQSDIYQTFLYAYAFRNAQGLPSALLIYPSDKGNSQTHLNIRDGYGYSQAQLYSLGIHVNSALDALLNPRDNPDTIFDFLREAIRKLFA